MYIGVVCQFFLEFPTTSGYLGTVFRFPGSVQSNDDYETKCIRWRSDGEFNQFKWGTEIGSFLFDWGCSWVLAIVLKTITLLIVWKEISSEVEQLT